MSAAYSGCAGNVGGDPRGLSTLGNGLANESSAKSTVSLGGTVVEIMCSEGESGGVGGADDGDKDASGKPTREDRGDSVSVEPSGEESARAAWSAGRDGEVGKSKDGETGAGAGVVGLGKYCKVGVLVGDACMGVGICRVLLRYVVHVL